MTSREGTWQVGRVSGFLPPFGVSKRIASGRGWTLFAGVRVAPFRVSETTLVYRGLPVRDDLEANDAGSWRGRGLFFRT
jgi:hypothetical protein